MPIKAVVVKVKNAKQKAQDLNSCAFIMDGAANQIRTGDLVLTKDVLYLLSHSSNMQFYRRAAPCERLL